MDTSAPAYSKELLTTEELAVRLKLRPETVLILARRGKIPYMRFSRRIIRYEYEPVVRALESTYRREAEERRSGR